jgi:SnoaL-like domain
MVSDPIATVMRYHDAWNEHDDARRLATLREIWADDGFYVDPEIPEGVIGPEALSAFIARSVEDYPGLSVAATTTPAVQCDRGWYGWTATADDGQSFPGIDFIEFATDGRIARLTNFYT